MTNFGALAILAALREHDAQSPRGQRRLRTVRTQSLLTALETFPAGADGWREVSAERLRESAELGRNAFDLGRRELTGAKLIEYQPGTHRGDKSRWRITFAVDEPPAKKVPPHTGDLPGPPKVPPHTGDLPGPKVPPHTGDLPKVPPQWGDSTTVEGAPTRPGKVTPPTVGGPSADSGPLTSHDTLAGADPGNPTALEPSALEPSSSRRTPRTGSRGEPAATDDDDDFERRPRPGPGYGLCPECGDWLAVRLAFGHLARHHDRARWGSTCHGSRRPPAEPVPCTGCGRTGLALTAIEGLCFACRRDRRDRQDPEAGS